MAKLSTRRYGAGLEPVGAAVEATARSTSKSAVSRRFVAATETALADMLAADLSGLDLVALMIDGVHFADHLCVVASASASTAPSTRSAWWRVTPRTPPWSRTCWWACATGALTPPGPSCASSTVPRHWWERSRRCSTIQWCTDVSFTRSWNVESRLPKALAATVAKKMRAAYHDPDALGAEATLEALARSLAKSHPGAAGSLREGLFETLTVTRLGVPPTLARTLRSTNAVESMIEICRDHSTNVKRWRDGQMALRWCAAGMGEAAKQFRRVNGFLHLPALRGALQAQVNEAVAPKCDDDEVAA